MATNLEFTNTDYYGLIAGKQMQRIVVTGTKAEIMTKLATVTDNNWLLIEFSKDSTVLLVARTESAFWAALFGIS